MKPKLRFKEFNDEWNEYILQSESDVRDGTHDSPKYIDNGYPLITSKNLTDMGTLDFSNVNYLKQEDFDKINQRSKVDIGDILFGMIGTIGRPVKIDRDDFAIKNVALIKEKGLIKNDYLIHYLHSSNINKQFVNSQDGGTQKFIALDKIRKLKINMPSRNEQTKIVSLFDLLDKKIELQSKKIEDLKLFKLSLREELFYMFPTDNKKLSEILIKWNKKNKANKYSYVESVSNKFGFIAQNEQFEDRNVASNDTSNYYVIEKGVFAYNPSRLNVGSLALKQNDKISLVSPLYECFTTNQNQDFMLEWFQSKELRRGTFSKYEGGVRNTLNFNNLSSIEINLPSIESQNKIVKVLSCYNKLIYLELAKLNKLQELKRGLMQQLFV